MVAPLKYVYAGYFQKSKNFLLPILGMRKDELFTPAGSYLWWNGGESIDNHKLIVTYEDHDPLVFESFEKRQLLRNPYFESCYSVKGGKVYIFDISSHHETIEKFVQGKYSKLSEVVKKRILAYHEASMDKIPKPGRYIHMSLYPELYYELVEYELETHGLKEVGELMDIPDKEKETLTIEIIGKCEDSKKKRIHLLDK